MFYLNLFEGNIIRVTFPYSPEAVEKVKQFSSRNWNQDLSCWEIPLKAAPEIPSVLNMEIPKNIKEAYDNIYSLKPVLYNPTLLRPEIKPYSFQIQGIEFGATHKNILLSDEVGLGKTLQSITISLHLDCKKILVVCPSSVKRQWKREIEKFTDKSVVVIEGTPKQRQQQYNTESMFYIVNYESVMKDLPVINLRLWDMVVADEVSRIKNFKSKSKSVMLQIRTNFKIAISATPIENRIQELHSIMSWVNPDVLGSYWNFINEYCYFCTNLYGGYTITGIKDAKKLHETLKSVMLRRKKSDVSIELPEIIYSNYYIPLSTTQRKMYKEIEENIMNLVQRDIYDENVLNQIIFLRELCNSPRLLNSELEDKNGKIDEIVEIIEQIINS
jgi:SNF2 family DNA or RNA helicase